MSHLAKTKTKPPKEDNLGKKEKKTNKGKKPKLRKAKTPNQERGDKPKPNLTKRKEEKKKKKKKTHHKGKPKLTMYKLGFTKET